MPPKKTTASVKKEKEVEEQPSPGHEEVGPGEGPAEARGEKDEEDVEDGANRKESKEHSIPKGHKRKKSTAVEEPNKATKTESSSTSSPVQVLKFLLSKEAIDICRPEDERKDLQERGKDAITYSQLLSPFEELVCAVVLSRPISHRLGLRTIRTILNPPYSFHTPEAIEKAGSEKVHQALWDARTQHKDKTADEIELIADAVLNNEWKSDLQRIRNQAKEDIDKEREILRSSIKGLGKTGLDIFYRRIQWTWKEAYPFIDERTQASMEKLGLPKSTQALEKAIAENWVDLEHVDKGDYSGEERKRRAFVVVLERAVGADLEKKTDQILEQASKL